MQINFTNTWLADKLLEMVTSNPLNTDFLILSSLECILILSFTSLPPLLASAFVYLSVTVKLCCHCSSLCITCYSLFSSPLCSLFFFLFLLIELFHKYSVYCFRNVSYIFGVILLGKEKDGGHPYHSRLYMGIHLHFLTVLISMISHFMILRLLDLHM